MTGDDWRFTFLTALILLRRVFSGAYCRTRENSKGFFPSRISRFCFSVNVIETANFAQLIYTLILLAIALAASE